MDHKKATIDVSPPPTRDGLEAEHAPELYRALIESAPDAIITIDGSGRMVLVNAQAERLFGWNRSELLGQPIEILVPERLRGRHKMHREGYARAPTTRRMGENLALSGLRRDGSEFPVDISLSPLATAQGPWISCSIRDATERRQTEHNLRRLNRLHNVLGSTNSLILRARSRKELFDQACRIAVELGGFRMAWIGIAVGDELKAAATFGASPEYTRNLRVSIHADDPHGRGPAGRAFRGRCPCIVNDIADDAIMAPWRDWATASGFQSAASFPLLAEGNVLGLLNLYAAEKGVFDDDEVRLLTQLAGDIAFAMESIAREERLDYLAYYDPVTRLANRSLFAERLARHLSASAAKKERLAVCIVDIERFRSVNASMGSIAGDELLQQLALRLADITSDVSRVGRIESNAFALILPHLERPEDVNQLMRGEAWSQLDRPYTIAGQELHVTLRSGVAVHPDNGISASNLLQNAAAALKNAKSRGERCLFYNTQMSRAMEEELRLEHDLRQAIEKQELALYYQPKIAVDSGRVCGAEALLRWKKADGTVVLPSRFVPLLEETGLIVEVGDWVLQQVAADITRWTSENVAVPRIGVNLSAVQLRQPGFLQQLLAVLATVGEHALELEITESVLIGQFEDSMTMLQELREHGCTIAIDDFGTGYSSLSYLRSLPADAIKIDQSFVRDLGSDPKPKSMVAGIIALARSLNLEIVAEGVQTVEQLQQLRRLGCDIVQGHLFSEALPPEDFARLLRSGEPLSLPPDDEPSAGGET